ncbi:Pr6Pr family membrane protein, partial [Microbacterium sp. AGC62]
MTTTWWPYLRIAAAVLAVAAIVAQLIRSLEIAGAATTEWGAHLPTVIANFFSFFTIESNVLAAVALACGGIWGLARRSTTTAEPRWLAILLMCASTYMIVTGVVYNLLLRGIELPQGSTVGWSNEVLHVVIPIIMLADVLFAPRRRALGWGAVGIAAIFPIVWVIYTLIRANLVIAPATGKPYWYPYPFLDPTQTGGYVGVSL